MPTAPNPSDDPETWFRERQRLVREGRRALEDVVLHCQERMRESARRQIDQSDARRVCDSMEAVNEVVERIYRNPIVRRLMDAPTLEDFTRYVRGVAKRMVLEMMSDVTEAPMGLQGGETAPHPGAGPDSQAVLEEQSAVTQRQLARIMESATTLAGDDRQIFDLYLEGQTDAEIAKRLDLKTDTIKKRRQRLLARLRRDLGAEGGQA